MNVGKKIPVLLLIIILFTVSLGIGLWLRRAVSTPNRVAPAPSPAPAKPPILPSPEFSGKPLYTAPAEQQFPTVVPVYQVAGALNTGDVTTHIGKLLGLTGAPRPSVGSDGTYYYWNSGGNDLGIGGNPVNIAYNTAADTSKPIAVPETELADAAVVFLEKLGLPGGALKLKRDTVSYLKTVGSDILPAPSLKDATLIQENFQFTLDGFPVVTGRPDTPGGSLQFTADKQIRSFRAFQFPPFIKRSSDASIIGYDEAVKRLKEQRGVLVSVGVEDTTNQMYFLTEAPSASSIYQTELGLYYAPEQPVLTPVFIFYGRGTRDLLTLVTVTMVSAAPDQ